MTVGIPGTGVGGLFYLGAAVLLPFRAFARRARARSKVGGAVVQAALATGMFAGMWATGWLVAFLIGPALSHHLTFGQRVLTAGRSNLIQWALLSLGYVVLGLLLLGVEIVRIVMRRRAPLRRPSGGHSSPRPSGGHSSPIVAM